MISADSPKTWDLNTVFFLRLLLMNRFVKCLEKRADISLNSYVDSASFENSNVLR